MMRLLIGIAAVSGMTLFSTWQGFGQPSRIYVTGALGPALTHDTDLKEFNGPIGPTTVKFDPGFQFRVAGGYQLTDWLATEVELGVSYNSIKSITGATEVDASLSHAPFLLNLVVQCPKKCQVTPYIGGGFGGSAAVLYADDIVINNNGTQNRLSGSQTDTVFAYHGFAGLRFNVNDRMGVSLAYRYFATTEPTWEADIVFPSGTGKTRFGDTQTHSITVAFSYRF